MAGLNPANASTVLLNFNGSEEVQYTTDGVKVQRQGFEFFTSSSYTHFQDITLHDDDGTLSSTLRPLNEMAFTPKSFKLESYSRVRRSGDGPAPVRHEDETMQQFSEYYDWTISGIAPLPILKVTGFLLSGATVWMNIVPSASISVSLIDFTDDFVSILSLRFDVLLPNGLLLDENGNYAKLDIYEGGLSGQNYCWYDYCADYRIDDLVYVPASPSVIPSPIPLPVSLSLFMLAMGCLVGVRSRRSVR